MSRIRGPRIGSGRSRTRPPVVLADRAYSSRAIRSTCGAGVSALSSHNRPTESATACGEADLVAGLPASTARQTSSATPWSAASTALKQWRGLTTRTDKLAIAYQAALQLAGILIWSRR
jgi:transposase